MQHRIGKLALCAAAAAVAALHAPPAHVLRVATWNLLAYDETAAPSRRPPMLLILPGLDPDLVIVQELLTPPAADSFASLLKTALPARVWKGGSSTFISTTQSAIYYDSLRVSISNLTSIATGGPRQVLIALVRPNGYRANAASFRLYSLHFKAGDGTVPSDSSTRTAECTSLLGYTRLTESQADNDGRLKDPFNMTGVWNNPSYAPYHSQSPCAGAGCVGSSGGWTTASTCCSAPIR